MEKKDLNAADWSVIGVYFAICLSLGIYSKFGKKQDTAEQYFLAGRSMAWWAVGGSLYASNMGSEHFIGLAGSGAATGIAVVAYEWHASWVLLLLGFFFVPIYIRSGIYTMPEYLKSRFSSKWMRIYLTVVCLISYVTTKIAVDIYAGGLFLKEAVGLNMYLSSFVLLTFTAVYTLLGGLAAVIYTDVIQCVIMLVGAGSLTFIGFNKVGGINGLWEKYPHAVGNSTFHNSSAVLLNSTSSCYGVEEGWNHIIRPLHDKEFPWIGVIFSLPISGIWYWCTDQVIVQRTLSAKSLAHARGGTITAGFLKLLPLFIMIMPGMIARVLFPDTIACPDPVSCEAVCGNKLGCSNQAFPELVLKILPSGLVGLMLAVMVAALMSSLSSAFNSASTIFTMDIWKVIRPKALDRELLIVGRVVVVLLVAVGIAWIPVVSAGGGGRLFTYLQTIQSYLAPPICAVFLVGMLWPRLTEAGALTSLLLGLLLGIIRLSLDIAYPQPTCGVTDDRPFLVKLHFMYYALVLLFLSITIMTVVSFFTQPVPIEKLGRLTWKTIDQPKYIETSRGNISESDITLEIQNKRSENELSAVGAYNEEMDNQAMVIEFERQSSAQRWVVWSAFGALLALLSALWIYFR